MTDSRPDATATDEGRAPELRRFLTPKLLLLFIVGDILGTGVYALTGDVAAEVGGAAWLPFILAFVIATLTAFSYLELVTKYPQAAGAALYTHKAFGIHFLTFLVAFTVMSSGITSASTASRLVARSVDQGFNLSLDKTGILLVALAFIVLLALINLRGVAHGVLTNVALTFIELTGLALVILVGIWAMTQGDADFSRVVAFDTPDEKNVFLAVTTATSLAFFAMVGFEDAVNMAEETKDPVRTFPRIMLTGLSITGIIYVLVSITAVALVPVGELAASETPLLTVVERGAPDVPIDEIYPFITMFAVANTALINMLMASRLIYGMAKQRVLPPGLAHVGARRQTPWVAILFTTVIACGLITYVFSASDDAIATLGGTTALLLLGVFTIVNITVLVLRRDPVDDDHFVTPTVLPVIAGVTSLYLVTPLSGRPAEQYEVAGLLLGIGVVLWAITWVVNRAAYGAKTYVKDPSELE
ncbi:APC family permease [Mumia sp. ZJ430]|uniref:APC family permease n=1 Tax=Mumia sp. ZJ430 TaxID=2708083 RepID=UPI00141EEE90|nr:APC family permease [Mumia sp. ZJ430]